MSPAEVDCDSINAIRNAYDTIRVSLFLQQFVIFLQLVFCLSNLDFLRFVAIK